MAVKRVYYLVHGGRVQGVGFRYFTKRHAAEHNLTGWVKNIPNEKVEGEVQGDEETIKTFLQLIDRGPSHAHVVRLDQADRDVVEGEAEFAVRR